MEESAPRLLRMVEQLKKNAELAYNSKDYSGTSSYIRKYNDLLATAKRNWPDSYLIRLHLLPDVSKEEFEKAGFPRASLRDVIMAYRELATFLQTRI